MRWLLLGLVTKFDDYEACLEPPLQNAMRTDAQTRVPQAASAQAGAKGRAVAWLWVRIA